MIKMRITVTFLNKILFNLLLISIFLLSFFNDFPFLSSRNFARSPSIYPFFISFIVIFLIIVYNLIYRKVMIKIAINNKIILISLLFLAWCGLSGIVNFDKIVALSSRRNTGLLVYLKNLGILVLYVNILFIINYILKHFKDQKKIFAKIRQTCLISFMVVLPYAILEIFAYSYNNNYAIRLLSTIEPLFHSRIFDIKDGLRVRGYAFEPSYFSLYIAFIFPWLLSYSFEARKKINYIVLFVVLIVIIYSESRVGYLVFLIEFMIFILSALCFKKAKKNSISMFLVLLIVGIILLLNSSRLMTIYHSLFEFKSNNISNVTRLASIHAAMLLGMENLIFGVGLGLAGAYLPEYYPDYAWLSYEMRSWASLRDLELGSPVFALFPRVFAEVGAIGLLIYVFLWLTVIIGVYRKVYRINIETNKIDYFGICLLASSIGLLLGSFAVDGFNFLGYWINIGMSAFYIYSFHPENWKSKTQLSKASKGVDL